MTDALVARLVMRIPDPAVRPIGKEKWHIYVCAERRWSLRINSRPVWPPHVAPTKADNAWPKRDSFAELRQVCLLPRPEVAAALADPARVIGRIGRATAALLVAEVRRVGTLTDEEKDVIVSSLGEV